MDHVTYSTLSATIQRLCGRGRLNSGQWDELLPMDFSGLDYCVVLHTVLPRVVDLNVLCWADCPASLQLEENMKYFVRSAVALSKSLDDVPQASLNALAVSPLGSPHSVADHIAVQTWLCSLHGRLGVEDHPIDPVRLRCTYQAQYNPCQDTHSTEPSTVKAVHDLGTRLRHARRVCFQAWCSGTALPFDAIENILR